MAEVTLNGLSKRQVWLILIVATVTAIGIWSSVLLQTIGLRIDMQTNRDAHNVCVAISNSYNLQLQRQRADTVASALDSLPLLECTPSKD